MVMGYMYIAECLRIHDNNSAVVLMYFCGNEYILFCNKSFGAVMYVIKTVKIVSKL